MSPLPGRITALLLAIGLSACGHYGPPRRAAPADPAVEAASAVPNASAGAAPENCEEPEKKAAAGAAGDGTERADGGGPR